MGSCETNYKIMISLFLVYFLQAGVVFFAALALNI